VSGRNACEIVRMQGESGDRFLVIWGKLTHPTRSATSLLSSRQQQIAHFAAVGATYPEIGRHLGISPNTVKHHLKQVYLLLGVSTRVELTEVIHRTADNQHEVPKKLS
jgi:DNA-binding NarL/FixJ family response regulator